MKNWQIWVTNKAETVLRDWRFPGLIKEAAWRAVMFTLECGQSHPVSFLLRPVVMHRSLKTAVGVNLVILGLAASIWAPSPLNGDNSGGPLVLGSISEAEVSTVTQSGVQVPVVNYHLSQKYWFLHSGIDLAAKLGEPIRPVMAGKVITAEKSWYGYGNLVVVTHGQEYESRYGHMSKILVTKGQEVDLNTVLGEVGSTGRSTGPHLHLEIWENGKPINPGPILRIK